MGIKQGIFQHLGFEPTDDQRKACDALERWMGTDKELPTLILRGYAGTGKTALLGAFAQTLDAEGVPFFLMAPTGRAAKVMSKSAGFKATTIHSHIYQLVGHSSGVSIELTHNLEEGAVFVVDEASMLGLAGEGGSVFNDRSLLDDLIEHVFHEPGSRLLLIGDPAQLPPVGQRDSPALDPATLRDRFFLTVGAVQLREVVRQAADSGVLRAATDVRSQIKQARDFPHLDIQGMPDVVDLPGYEMEDELENAYGKGGDHAVVICRTNKQVLEYSKHIRARVHGFEEELCVGDRLMVVKNDMFWAKQEFGEPSLIANGEMITVTRVFGVEEFYGSRFARLLVELDVEGKNRELRVVCNLDILNSEQPGLSKEQRERIFENAMEFAEGKNRREKLRKIRTDEYFMALHVKYAYAITCHKAQGGQWPVVFLDQGFVSQERAGTELLRWTYTAITRAQEKLYLVNYPREQLVDS